MQTQRKSNIFCKERSLCCSLKEIILLAAIRKKIYEHVYNNVYNQRVGGHPVDRKMYLTQHLYFLKPGDSTPVPPLNRGFESL